MIRAKTLLVGLFFLQSCALITSYKSFKLERDPISSFQSRQVFSDSFSHTVMFFEDGSFLSISELSPDKLNEYLDKNKYKIYKKFDDHRFKWGVYKVAADTVTIELHEKVHQWGIIKICRWKGIIRENQLKILALEREAKNGLDFFTFTSGGKLFKTAEAILDYTKIDPRLSWINY